MLVTGIAERLHRSIEVAVWHRAKDTDEDCRKDKCSNECLDEDGVLNLAESGLLDPNFTVEDLPNDIAFLVLGNPRLVLVAVGPRRFEGIFLFLDPPVDVFAFEEFPWPEMAMMHAVQNDAHTFPSGNKRGDADHEWDERHNPPATSSTA